MRIKSGAPWLLAVSLAAAQSPTPTMNPGDPNIDNNGGTGSGGATPIRAPSFQWNDADFRGLGIPGNVIVYGNPSGPILRNIVFEVLNPANVTVRQVSLNKNLGPRRQKGAVEISACYPPSSACPLSIPTGAQQSPASSATQQPAGEMAQQPAASTTAHHKLHVAATEAPSSEAQALVLRQHSPGVLTFNWENSTGLGSIQMDPASFSTLAGAPLYFEVLYLSSAGWGKTYSRWFTITSREVASNYAPLYLDGNVAFVDEPPPGTRTGSGGTDGSQKPMPTTGDTDPATMPPPINGGGSPSAPSPGGLSTGTVIGIAVGCGVAGLILVGALAWFLIRRSRKQRAAAAPYGSDRHRRTAELIAEKEATAGVNESPHSPYSDDGHGHPDAPTNRRGLAGAGGDSAAGVLLHSSMPDERSYTPYTDAAAPSQPRHTPSSAAAVPVSSRSPSRAAGGARSATPEGRYAHLMSPDMTPEERARIEEEERALDRAIEEAGRASRP